MILSVRQHQSCYVQVPRVKNIQANSQSFQKADVPQPP